MRSHGVARFGVLASLLAVVAILAGASEASAHPLNPYWYSDGQLINEGEMVHVKNVVTESKSLVATGNGFSIACMIKYAANDTNPVGGGAGLDEITQFESDLCKATPHVCPKPEKTQFVGRGLPWGSHLVPGPPIGDLIEGIEVQLVCAGVTVLDTYTGSLTATVGNSIVEFGAGAGELEDAMGNKLAITGTETIIGPNHDKVITAN